jgi:hypothetical protein
MLELNVTLKVKDSLLKKDNELLKKCITKSGIKKLKKFTVFM